MEDELIKNLKKIKIKPVLIDPRAEMKVQKAAGNTETLVDYERIGELASQASTLYSNYLNEKALPGSNISTGNLIDLDILGNQVSHDHSRNFQVNPS